MQQEAQAHGASKGPRVYLDYTQAELDAAYDQAAYAPNRDILQSRRLANSAAVRLRLGEPERFAYGPSEIERLDVYRTRRDKAPIFIFIHGGAWRNRARQGACLRRRDLRAPGRALRGARFHAGPGCRPQPHADSAAGAQRHRLDLPQRDALRRRSGPALSRRPFLGRASCGLRADRGLAKGFRRSIPASSRA